MPTHGRGQRALIPADLWYFRVLARITAVQTCGSVLLEDRELIYIVKCHKLVAFFFLLGSSLLASCVFGLVYTEVFFRLFADLCKCCFARVAH